MVPIFNSFLPLFDGHLDLAWNALSFNRDLTLPLDQLREIDASYPDAPYRGSCLITLEELAKANLKVCVATLLARSGPHAPPAMLRRELDYAHPSIAHGHAYGQFSYYLWLQKSNHVRIIKSRRHLDDHWENPNNLGLILSFEGCDPVLDLDDLYLWFELGVRVAGLTHYGVGQYAGGTNTRSGLTPDGFALLREFQELGMILDITHLSDESIEDVFNVYDGPIIASHHNCREIVPGQRQLSNDHIKELIHRDAVIGTALDAWMLYPGWKRNQTDRSVINFDDVIDHMEHICSIAGSSKFVGIGSDLDGGFGVDQTPTGLDRYAHLHLMADVLSLRGFAPGDIHNIFYQNWLNFFQKSLPVL
ncbi:MAG: membrane dipeptidase [Bacteroidetes bacterium]|nr:membrane dipeptidase [Bacteroidota bacterium]